MSSPYLLPLLSTILGGLFLHKLWKTQTSRKVLLPPGPKSYPVIGHLLSMPTGFEHLAFIELGKQLGAKMYSLSTFGTTIVVLNDVQDAINLFDKRSAIYSDRTSPPMHGDPSLLDWANFGALAGYGDRWRKYRRLMNPWLNKAAATQFQQSQLNNTRLFLDRLLDSHQTCDRSSTLEDELFRATASTLYRSIYGYRLKSLEDPFLVDARLTIDHSDAAFLPSNFLVNAIPALLYVPDWFPGTQWKRTGNEWRAQKEQAIRGVYQWAIRNIADGNDDGSMVAGMVQHARSLSLSDGQTEDYVREVAFTLLIAGMDTTTATMIGFILAMILFPDVKAKAQKEIDAIVGLERLPNMEDQSRLPYVGRIVQETVRWFPPVPLGIPHTCYADDVYEGYDITKGTIVVGNIWAMTRDPSEYKDPDTFDPDRFLDPSVPASPAFGWGRRRCPGLYFANASLFIMIASFLATFDIEMAKDQDGKDIVPSNKVESATVLRPEPFRFKLTPRSARHEALIRAGA